MGKKDKKMFRALLNGHPKVTIIESFNGEVSLVRPGQKIEFKTLREATAYVADQGWEINVEIIMGTNIKREIRSHEETHAKDTQRNCQ